MKYDTTPEKAHRVRGYMRFLNDCNLYFLEEGREDAIIRSEQLTFIETILDMLVACNLTPSSVCPTFAQSVQLDYEDKNDENKLLEVIIYSDLSTEFWTPTNDITRAKFTPSHVCDLVKILTKGWEIDHEF